jgi:hypothetical protein
MADPVATEALQGLTAAVASLLPAPADPSLTPVVSLSSVRIGPLGVGGFVGTNADPAGQIVGRRVQASVVLGVKAATENDVPDAVDRAVTAIVAADRRDLRELGILRVSLAGVGLPDGGPATERDLSVDVLYEFLKPPQAPEGAIIEIPLELDVDTSGHLRTVFSAVPFDAGAFASFDVVDDPNANRATPSAWSFDAANEVVRQTSKIFGGSTTTNANKPGTYLLLRTGPSTPPLADVAVRAEAHSDGDRGIGLVARFVDPGNFYFFLIEQAGPYRRIGKKVGGTFAELDTPAVDLTQGYEPGTTHRLRLECRGDVLRASIDEQVVVEGRDSSIAGPGRAGLMTKGNDQASFGTFEVLEI